MGGGHRNERRCSLKPLILGLPGFEVAPSARGSRYEAWLWSASPSVCSFEGLALFEEKHISGAEVLRLLGHRGASVAGEAAAEPGARPGPASAGDAADGHISLAGDAPGLPPSRPSVMRVVAAVRCVQRFWDLKLT